MAKFFLYSTHLGKVVFGSWVKFVHLLHTDYVTVSSVTYYLLRSKYMFVVNCSL